MSRLPFPAFSSLCLSLLAAAAVSAQEKTEAAPSSSPAGSGSVAPVSARVGCDTAQNESAWYKKDLKCPEPGNQYSLLANISDAKVSGGQAALFANITTDEVQKYQIAGTLNYAHRVRTQLAWSMNFARRVDRLQIGGWNIADTVKGMQLGLINISKELDGTSIGLLTLTRNGILHVDATTDETGMARIAFASGKKFYTSYSFGYTPEASNHPFSIGVGFGRQWSWASRYFESELTMHMIADRHTDPDLWKEHDKDPDLHEVGFDHLVQAKVRLGQALFGKVSLFGGLTYNIMYVGSDAPLSQPWSNSFTIAQDDMRYWPGVEVGLRLGR
jgi:hypothetical protein